MTILLESDIEQMAIELLTAKRWEYLYGPTIAPDGETPMRRTFDEVVLREKLEQAVKRLNPTQTDAVRDEAVKTVLRIASPDVLANCSPRVCPCLPIRTVWSGDREFG